MNHLKKYITEYGAAKLVKTLGGLGIKISEQNLNHWKTRGVPYKFHNKFIALSGLCREDLRKEYI
jgi:hypothetical protein